MWRDTRTSRAHWTSSGIGFDEWRLFQYKSATEAYVRRGPIRGRARAANGPARRLVRSRPPRHQHRSLACARALRPPRGRDRSLPASRGPQRRLSGSPRTLGAKSTAWLRPSMSSRADSYARPANRRWGQRKRIAIVYALGICAMDTGIGARRLVGEIASACAAARRHGAARRFSGRRHPALGAGGRRRAAMPRAQAGHRLAGATSRLRAATCSRCPVMAIVAAPNTITGSIGVVAGWAYNKGLKEKLGLSTSRVQGGSPRRLAFWHDPAPCSACALPDRTLSADESVRMEHTIRSLYADFVAKVANSRHIAPDSVEVMAQGRVLERPARRTTRPRRPDWRARSGHRASQGKNRAVGGRDCRIDGAAPGPRFFRPRFFVRGFWASLCSPPPNLTTCNFASSTMACPCCWFPPIMYLARWGLYGEKTYE